MPLLNIQPPPGMYRNGTPYSRKGRWVDGNLVRWHDGSIRVIGGWERRRAGGGTEISALVSDPAAEAVRDTFAWRDLNNNLNAVFCSNAAIYHMSELGVITDITYAGFSPVNSSKDPDIPTGYGTGLYGAGPFGVSTGNTGATVVPPDRWYCANFGEILLTGVRNNGDIYELDLGTLTLTTVTNAPTQVQDICVTEQRQVIAIGADGEARRLQATDLEDRTDWTPATANQAVDRVVDGTGKLLRCIPVLRQVLLLGENDARTVRYIGPPYVYSVELAGENCGPLTAEAVSRTERFAVWWGQRNFWIFDGSVKQLSCDVIDFLYEDIDLFNASKIASFTNTEFSEVWWLYQSQETTTGEVDSYVFWDYAANTWSTGRLDRTAGIDAGVLSTPVYVSSDGEIYNHELTEVFPSEGSVFVETGGYELGNGEVNLPIQFIYPDSENLNCLSHELITRQLPTGAEFTYGPYTCSGDNNNPIPTTGVMGREVKLRITMTNAPGGEIGKYRLDFAGRGGGKR